MLNSFIRLMILGVLAIAAVSIFFFMIHIVIRLVIFGALALGALWLIRSFRGGSGKPQG